MDGENNSGGLSDFLSGALDTAGGTLSSYFQSQTRRPPAATANANRQQNFSLPLMIGGALVLVLVLVFALRR